MPSMIATFGDLDRRLESARKGVRDAIARHPEIDVLPEIGAQLDALHDETRDGARPSHALRDRLDFGQLASRHLHAAEPALARDLYEIASWVAYA
ncbi:Hypothetical protein A7982_05047 [Minicystis rosea]|nr:Hypothetical protein A7982_05047 [Minicystis rosea]